MMFSEIFNRYILNKSIWSGLLHLLKCSFFSIINNIKLIYLTNLFDYWKSRFNWFAFLFIIFCSNNSTRISDNIFFTKYKFPENTQFCSYFLSHSFDISGACPCVLLTTPEPHIAPSLLISTLFFWRWLRNKNLLRWLTQIYSQPEFANYIISIIDISGACPCVPLKTPEPHTAPSC